MEFFNLGNLNWKQTQLIYHILAYNNIECLVLSSPCDKYVSVGLHQNPRDELDIDFCKKNNIGIFRRETGGGIVLLDNNQLFYNIILHRNNPDVPHFPEPFFRKFLQPVIQTYNELGISAEFHPLCDLLVKEKKISGNGGGEIGECKVLVGNILLDFDYKLMSQVILSPESLRARFLELMENNITTVKKELEFVPAKEKICSILVKNFEDLIGKMTKGKVIDKITKKMTELDKHYSSEKWLYQRGTKQIGREIKVREGVLLFYETFNTKEGNIGITCETKANIIKKVSFDTENIPFKIDKKKLKDRFIGLEYDKNKLAYKMYDLLGSCGVVTND